MSDAAVEKKQSVSKCIYWVRTGQTTVDAAVDGNNSKNTPNVELTGLGVDHVNRLQKAFAHQTFDTVFVSPLRAAQQSLVTMRIQSKTIITDDRCRAWKQYPSDFLPTERVRSESLEDLYGRVASFLETLASLPDSTILVVTHPEILSMIFEYDVPCGTYVVQQTT